MSVKDSITDAGTYLANKISEKANDIATEIMNTPSKMKNNVMDSLNKMANPQPSPEEKKSTEKEEKKSTENEGKKTDQDKLMDDMQKVVEELQKMVNQMFSQKVLSAVDYFSSKKSNPEEPKADTPEDEEVDMSGIDETNLFSVLPGHADDCTALDERDVAATKDLFAQLPFHEDDGESMGMDDVIDISAAPKI